MPDATPEDLILNSVKIAVDVPVSLDVFDQKLLMYTNAAFMTLDDFGVGPEGGYLVLPDSKWSDFFPADEEDFEDYFGALRTYVGMYVRQIFDPPDTGFVLTSMEKTIEQMAWRLNVRRENRLRKQAQEPSTS